MTATDAVIATLALMQAVPPPPPPDVVVTARAGEAPPDRFAERLRAACWDPLRLRGAVAPPGPGWIALPELSARLPAASADAIWELAADERGRTLTLLVERRDTPWNTRTTRCTLIASEGRDHAAIPRLVAGLTGGMTERHVGAPDGVVAMPGWRQRLATRIPMRGSRGWPAPPGRSRDTYTVVIDPGFYDRSDHVAVEVRARDDEALTIASVTLTERRPLARASR